MRSNDAWRIGVAAVALEALLITQLGSWLPWAVVAALVLGVALFVGGLFGSNFGSFVESQLVGWMGEHAAYLGILLFVGGLAAYPVKWWVLQPFLDLLGGAGV